MEKEMTNRDIIAVLKRNGFKQCSFDDYCKNGWTMEKGYCLHNGELFVCYGKIRFTFIPKGSGIWQGVKSQVSLDGTELQSYRITPIFNILQNLICGNWTYADVESRVN